MFLKDTDYKTAITEDDLDIVQQSDDTVREAAEAAAIEMMSGYLRSRYNIELIFADTPTKNKVIVMYCIDITLYNLHSALPGRFVPETRRVRYDDAIDWLKDVASGKVDPGLPAKNDDTGEPVTQILYGSNQKQSSEW